MNAIKITFTFTDRIKVLLGKPVILYYYGNGKPVILYYNYGNIKSHKAELSFADLSKEGYERIQ